MNLLSALPLGTDHARTLSELAETLRCSRREVEAAVQDARLRGVPIISGARGVWLTTSPQEARSAAEALRARARHQLETAQALERAADRMDARYQQTSWLDAA